MTEGPAEAERRHAQPRLRRGPRFPVTTLTVDQSTAVFGVLKCNDRGTTPSRESGRPWPDRLIQSTLQMTDIRLHRTSSYHTRKMLPEGAEFYRITQFRTRAVGFDQRYAVIGSIGRRQTACCAFGFGAVRPFNFDRPGQCRCLLYLQYLFLIKKHQHLLLACAVRGVITELASVGRT